MVTRLCCSLNSGVLGRTMKNMGQEVSNNNNDNEEEEEEDADDDGDDDDNNHVLHINTIYDTWA